jgi:hypothetical protein
MNEIKFQLLFTALSLLKNLISLHKLKTLFNEITGLRNFPERRSISRDKKFWSFSHILRLILGFLFLKSLSKKGTNLQFSIFTAGIINLDFKYDELPESKDKKFWKNVIKI